MTDKLREFYDRELSFIRKLAAEFAKAHPKIAGRLYLREDSCDDPHVERMIEAFALLNARIRHKLDDEFPEITDALLGVLYPHYQVPLPSVAIAQFELDRGQGELLSGYRIAEEAVLETEPEPLSGESCRFRTCYPVQLWPIKLTGVSYSGPPFRAPRTPPAARALGMLKLELQCLSGAVGFRQLAMSALRCFLKGQPQYVYPLYELIMNHTVAVVLAESTEDREPVLSGPQNLKPVGFERNEGVFPYSSRSFLGYRLLTEFFAFPEKFLFFDLVGLDKGALSKFGNKMELYFFFNRGNADLEANVSIDTVRLGCTPMTNLFSLRAEPIQLTQKAFEYRVVPDARRPLATEVFSIDRVTATSPDGDQIEYQPFYSFRHAIDRGQQRTFWHSTRRPAQAVGNKVDSGTEVFISLVDLNLDPKAPPDWILDIETTCLNRDLPRRLPSGGERPYLQMAEGAPVSRVACLTRPKPTLRPALKRGAQWRLISHLSLNHLSLINHEDGAAPLREILALYDYADSEETRSLIDAVLTVGSRRVIGPSLGIPGAFCRGHQVTIEFDEERFAGSGLFLFASVLERFLGLYCNINSFSQMIATTKRRGELRRWPPRAGEKVIL